jgi:ubiquinone/menaquinone biosynthesis C-methylase UbiE
MSGKLSPYLRLIAQSGFTRHPGGLKSDLPLFKRAQINENSRVLDLGCGAGHVSAFVAREFGAFVTGLDINQIALAQASAYYASAGYGDRLRFLLGDLKQLPLPDQSFDIVLCESVLIFIKDKKKALAEMERVLKPNGYLIINEICLNNSATKEAKDFFHDKAFGGFIVSSQSFLKMLQDRNFTIDVVEEGAFDLRAEAFAHASELFSKRGILQSLESAFSVALKKDVRQDFYQVLKLVLKAPKSLHKSLTVLKLLLLKKG